MVVMPLVVTITAATRLCSGTHFPFAFRAIPGQLLSHAYGWRQMACLRDPHRNGAPRFAGRRSGPGGMAQESASNARKGLTVRLSIALPASREVTEMTVRAFSLQSCPRRVL